MGQNYQINGQNEPKIAQNGQNWPKMTKKNAKIALKWPKMTYFFNRKITLYCIVKIDLSIKVSDSVSE